MEHFTDAMQRSGAIPPPAMASSSRSTTVRRGKRLAKSQMSLSLKSEMANRA